MGRQVLALVIKELLAVLRDPRSRMVLIGPPLIQLLVFGYAASYDLNRVPIAVYNQDQSQASRDLVARFAGSPAFAVEETLDSTERIDALVDARDVQMVLVIHRNFTRNLLTGQPAPVQLVLDGRNSNTALLIQGYANTILQDFALAWRANRGAAAPPALLNLRSRYNPTLTSHWFIIPGIVALLTQVVTVLVVGLSVAREREMGTFDQLLVTPLRQVDILLGKGLPGLLIGSIEATIVTALAVFWFDIPLRGGLGALYLGVLLFVLAITGIGLAISALSKTQQQALLGAFLFIVPSVILSGFATPLDNMPGWVQTLTLANPMRYFLVIVRGVFIEGAGVSDLVSQYWPMAVIGIATLALAGWLFRRRMA
ncbi:MAG: ABC transporter permease [Alphaproteobacteria bacterium]|nr:ABC transporter permease [Alphaproteobacteria bacterium]